MNDQELDDKLGRPALAVERAMENIKNSHGLSDSDLIGILNIYTASIYLKGLGWENDSDL